MKIRAEISGIEKLKIIDKNSILIKHAAFDLLVLSCKEKDDLSEATVRIGECFTLSDADHISETYRLIAIKNDSVILEAELIFTGVGVPEDEWIEKEKNKDTSLWLKKKTIAAKKIETYDTNLKGHLETIYDQHRQAMLDDDLDAFLLTVRASLSDMSGSILSLETLTMTFEDALIPDDQRNLTRALQAIDNRDYKTAVGLLQPLATARL